MGTASPGAEGLVELVGYIARALVEEPDRVLVRATEDDKGYALRLEVAQGDLGKVIGREGRTARAMRVLLSTAARRMDTRATLEIAG